MKTHENPGKTWLEIDEADGPRRFPLTADHACLIGRSETSTVVLLDDLVSRNHAMIQSLDVGSYALVDLGSVNGTYVGGRRISFPTVLKNGDKITFGRVSLRFCQETPAAPEPPGRDESDIESTNVYRAEKLISVLVVDIRDYTRLAQKLEAGTLSQVVRTFFSEAGKPLLAAGSWAQKYIGDAIMSVWIHDKPGSRPGDEVLAILQALMLVVHIAGRLQEQFGLAEPIRVGAGLNSGPASVGNVGSIASADYTAVGDVVNKAFRLETATKQVHCDLLMGRETVELLLRCQPRVAGLLAEYKLSLKGYEETVPAWGVSFETLDRELGLTAELAGS